MFVATFLFYMMYDYNVKQIESYKSAKLQALLADYSASFAAHEDVANCVFDLVVKRQDILSLVASAYDNSDKNETIRTQLQGKLVNAYDILDLS